LEGSRRQGDGGVVKAAVLKRGGPAAQVARSQRAPPASNYVVLAVAARNLDAAGLAALSSYYLLINTVGRGLFAAVELETTRAVAAALAAGKDDAPARRAALRHTGMLLAGALVLLVASTPLLGGIMGSAFSAIGLLAVGAVGMAASYLLRGPLAGRRRYGLYAVTFWAEAGLGLAAAAALVLLGDGDPTWWIASMALAPLAAAAVLARPALRGVVAPGRAGGTARPGIDATGTDSVGSGSSATRAVIWSAALLLAGQGVWNLAPVLVTSRLADTPAVAAGFFTVAVILRAPVLFFPSVQALLLPVFAEMAATGRHDAVRRTTRRIGGVLVVAGAVWIAIAIFVVPAVSHLVFGATLTPPLWVLAVLAASTVVGAAAQIGQTHLVAIRRPAAAALAWIAGLGLLLVVGLLAAPPLPAAAVGQLAGALAVLVVLSLVRRRTLSPS
jgi:O-antigen/teichoic acid export membrane protein